MFAPHIKRRALSSSERLLSFKAVLSGVEWQSLLELMERLNLNMVYASLHIREGVGLEAIVTIDYTNSPLPLHMLVDSLKRRVKVLKLFKRGFEDAASEVFPLTVNGERAVLVTSEVLKWLITGIRARFGSAGEAMQYYMGFDVGFNLGRMHMDIGRSLRLKGPIEVLEKVTAPLFACMGYGIMRVMRARLQEPYVQIGVARCFECELAPKGTRPYSQLVRGYMAGLVTALLGRQMRAYEVLCIAKGDEICVFDVYS